MSEGLGTRRVAQIAIVVRDIEASAERWATFLGVEKPRILVTAPGLEVRQSYRGRPSNDQAKLAFFEMENLQIELIEPIGTESSWSEALEKNGEGVHHIAFWTENMANVKAHLDRLEIPLIHRGDMGDAGQFAYFDAVKSLGTFVEVLENQRTEIV